MDLGQHGVTLFFVLGADTLITSRLLGEEKINSLWTLSTCVMLLPVDALRLGISAHPWALSRWSHTLPSLAVMSGPASFSFEIIIR